MSRAGIRSSASESELDPDELAPEDVSRAGIMSSASESELDPDDLPPEGHVVGSGVVGEKERGGPLIFFWSVVPGTPHLSVQDHGKGNLVPWPQVVSYDD